MAALAAACFGLIGLAAGAPGARAEEVRFALTVDYELLAVGIARALGAATGEPSVLWRSDDDCTTLAVEDFRIRPADGRLEIRAGGRGRAGFGLFGWCLFPLRRDAELRIVARPTIDPTWRLTLADVDAELRAPDGATSLLTRRIGALVEERIEATIASAQVDLAPPIDEVRSIVGASLYGEQAHRARAALDSLRPLDAVPATDGIRIDVAMEVPPATPVAIVPEPALTLEERTAWERALADWDAFLTFAIKQLGIRDRDPEVIDALFALFVDGRHAVLGVLASGPRPGDDPVRALFLDSWETLRGIVRRVSGAREGDDVALHFLRFLAAGDALAALERVGPDVGLEISADGLRRLARTLDPETALDPFALGDEPDQALRDLFGFHEPPATLPAPRTPGVPPRSTAPPAGAHEAVEPEAWWRPPWPAVLGAVAAHAAAGPAAPAAASTDLAALGAALDRRIPAPDNVNAYRDLVSRLLDTVAEGEHAAVPETLRTLFRQLVRTVAWQESCWRQFVRRDGRILPLESSTDDVGIMQVNRRVWRGVFDRRQLEWDVVYNADAGAQVVAQMLTRYGRRESQIKGGSSARATYSAYNGGPAAYRRYRTGARATRYTRIADAAFWKKFQITAKGGELAHVPCVSDVT